MRQCYNIVITTLLTCHDNTVTTTDTNKKHCNSLVIWVIREQSGQKRKMEERKKEKKTKQNKKKEKKKKKNKPNQTNQNQKLNR